MDGEATARHPYDCVTFGQDDAALRDPPRRRRYAAPLAIAVVGLALYVPGLTWGLPGTTSWSQDTVAAFRTLGALEGWPGDWKGRYPPLQYLILGAAYKPLLYHWERTGQSTTDADSGRQVLQPPHAAKVGLLILIARGISALMGIAAGIGLWAATRRFLRDDLAALLAAVALMIGASFTYFAHLGNVDVPSVCWFAWSIYFYARALNSRSWVDCAWLGLFAALASCTKDAVAAVYPGMAIVLLGDEIRRRVSAAKVGRAILAAVWQRRWPFGLAAFALPYLVINGMITDPDGFVSRMRYWVAPAPDSLHARQYRYPDQFQLLLAALRYAAGGVGWPMLAAMAVAVVWVLRRHARLGLALLIPAGSYYLIVITQIRFVYTRFLFPVLALACVALGAAGSTWLRRKRPAVAFRYGVASGIALLSLVYAVAIDLEMLADSRDAAEAWFAENAQPASSVGAFSKPQYLPRLGDLGWKTYSVSMAPATFDRPQPEYLILTSYNYTDFDAPQTECMQGLLDGRLGYKPVAKFYGRYLGPALHG